MVLTRRELLSGAVAAGGLWSLGCRAGEPAAGARSAGRTGGAGPTDRMPVAFVGHGSPMIVLDEAKGAELRAWGSSIPEPRAILVVSAHWEQAPATLGPTRAVPLIYDFYGFPPELYRVRYPAPAAPELARRVAALVPDVRIDEDRGLDHGTWTPLRWLFPDARIPVLQLSIPSHDPRALHRLGHDLAPLRDEGVFLLGSGNVVHNLRRIARRPDEPTPSWAAEFDQWLVESLARRDVDSLLDWERRAPAATLAHPTVEHFVPLLVSLGAATDDLSRLHYPISGFEHSSISRRSLSWGQDRRT